MSRYQFASIMMLMWGILGRLEKGTPWAIAYNVIGLAYAVEVVYLTWKHRNDGGAA
jgi:hypothetical protein